MKLPTAAIASLLLVFPISVLARFVEEESSSKLRSRHIKTQDINIGKGSGDKSRVFIKYTPNKKGKRLFGSFFRAF